MVKWWFWAAAATSTLTLDETTDEKTKCETGKQCGRFGGVKTSPDCSNSDAVWQFDSTEETLILTSDTLKENQRETVQTFNTQDQRSDEREIRRESSELWIYP